MSGRVAAAAALVLLALLLRGVWSAPPAAGQDEIDDEQALADSLAAAVQDSIDAAAESGLAAAIAAARAQSASGAWVLSWMRDAQTGLRADVSKVRYSGGLQSNMVLRGARTLSTTLNYSVESYRRQDKTVELRSGTVLYAEPRHRYLTPRLRLTNDWSEDRTVNTANVANVNKRDFKQADLTLDTLNVNTGRIRHAAVVSARFDDQSGESLGQTNSYQEGNLAGALRSYVQPLAGVNVRGGVYGLTNSGERKLGDQTSPSSSNQDSVSALVRVARGQLDAYFTVRRAHMSKRYLDYRRNVNGIVDTLGIPPLDKIVQETQRLDALQVEMRGQHRVRGVRLTGSFKHTEEEDRLSASLAGMKERGVDGFDVAAGFRIGADSLRVTYLYEWRWDDQRYRGATSSRGRQVSKRRDISLNWHRRLFRHTDWNVTYNAALQQDIAQGQFNDNDRDRYQTSLVTRVQTSFPAGIKPSFTFSARHVEDVAIRRTRSANNNVKDYYEIVPGYGWPIASWLRWQQDYRLAIEFTDYVYGGGAGSSLRDNYSKRGSLISQVSLRPSQRLSLTVRHERNARFNASRALTDASGRDIYATDVEQRISTIDFGLNYKVNESLTVEGATDRTKDIRDTFGRRVTTVDQRSGKVMIGATLKQKWGASRELSASVRKRNAFGPSVQRTNADFWDADATFSWRF